MPSVTISREEAVQRWPVEKNAPLTAASTATLRSASSSTTSGFLPPISSWTFFIGLRGDAGLRDPAAGLDRTGEGDRGDVGMIEQMSDPRPSPEPITRLNTPAGMPERAMISDSACAEPGTSSAGLKTTVLPKHSAGAIFHAGIAIGKFHGVIRPTTPTASRVISTSRPGRTEAPFSPESRKRLAGKEREDLSGARDLADALRQCLAFLSRQQATEFVLAGEDFGGDAVERVKPLLRCRARPFGERRLGRGDRLQRLGRIGLRIFADDVIGIRRVDVSADAGTLGPFTGDIVLLNGVHLVSPIDRWRGVSAHQAGTLVVERPAGNQELHGHRIVARAQPV